MSTPKVQQQFYPVTPKIADPDLAPLYQEAASPACSCRLMPQEGASDGFFSTHKLMIIFAVIIVIIFFVILYVYLTHRGGAKKNAELDASPPAGTAADLAEVDLAELNKLRAQRLQRGRIPLQGELQAPNNASFRGGSLEHRRVQQFSQNLYTDSEQRPSATQNRQMAAAAPDRQMSTVALNRQMATAAPDRQVRTAATRDGQMPTAATARDRQMTMAAQNRQTSTASRDGQTTAAAQNRQMSITSRDEQITAATQNRQTFAAVPDEQMPAAAQDGQTFVATSDRPMSATAPDSQMAITQNMPPVLHKPVAQSLNSEAIDSQKPIAEEELVAYEEDVDIETYLKSLRFEHDDSPETPAV